MKYDNIIIGAGPAGLQLGYFFSKTSNIARWNDQSSITGWNLRISSENIAESSSFEKIYSIRFDDLNESWTHSTESEKFVLLE